MEFVINVVDENGDPLGDIDIKVSINKSGVSHMFGPENLYGETDNNGEASFDTEDEGNVFADHTILDIYIEVDYKRDRAEEYGPYTYEEVENGLSFTINTNEKEDDEKEEDDEPEE